MSSALKTITDYIDDGRVLLQDEVAPYRYDDDSLLVAMNVALLEGRRLRPDLFIFQKNGSYVQSFQDNDGTELVMEEQFRLAFLHGMCAHALERDMEDIQDNRAASFAKTFQSILIGAGFAIQAPQQMQPQG